MVVAVVVEDFRLSTPVSFYVNLLLFFFQGSKKGLWLITVGEHDMCGLIMSK